MTKYLDKDAVVAEIERRKKKNEEWKNSCKGIDSLAASMVIQEDINILSFLNTLEVKEEKVDLEQEMDFVKDAYYYFTSDERDSMMKVARHFFELGIKAKGE